ncbi:hypothetical protein [Asaia sp. HN010]|uniref:hypothetical protein n=1 Tax=Asaia sp. HN010 TaxID=3081233 RepID=UPI003018D201
MTYDNGTLQKMFAANEAAIYDITSAANVQVAASGMHSGDWSYTQFATSGGVFLVAVNGVDPLQLYDGERWWPIGSGNVVQLSIGSTSGTFEPGDAITGEASDATGTILYIEKNTLYVTATNDNAFKSGEVVKNQGSAATTLSGDGAVYWAGINSANAAIAKIETSQFSFVWSYMSRLFFIERGSLNVWYLQIDSIGGNATLFPMGGVFPQGGALMLGSTWSLDNSNSGGLSEQCIMATDAGEVAVYQGVDPSIAETWGKVGLYRIDKPRGPRAFVRNGGDLLIATDTGLIPLTQAVNRSVNTLSAGAASYPIQDVWAQYVEERPDRTWQVIIWPENQMLAVAIPNEDSYQPFFLVMNINTGAWARFTNWNAKSLCVFRNSLYFGSVNSKIVSAWQTGSDMGAPFAGVYAPLFTDLGGTAIAKIAKDVRVTLRGTYETTWQVSMLYDYIVNVPPPPTPPVNSDTSVWNQAIWDESRWNASVQLRAQSGWTPVSGMGYALSPCLQISSGNLLPYDTEIMRLDLTYVGGMLLS